MTYVSSYGTISKAEVAKTGEYVRKTVDKIKKMSDKQFKEYIEKRDQSAKELGLPLKVKKLPKGR